MRIESDALSIEDLRRAARARLPRSVFEFFDGGAEDEITLRANRRAFERVRLLPKVLVDVSSVDTSTGLLGAESKMPLAVAPTGAVGFGWPGGDVAIAKAAAAYGIPYTLSTTATASIERVAREAPGRLWFQAYILKGREFTFRLIERARLRLRSTDDHGRPSGRRQARARPPQRLFDSVSLHRAQPA